MARYEFQFIVTDTGLSEELQQKVGQVGEQRAGRYPGGTSGASAVR